MEMRYATWKRYLVLACAALAPGIVLAQSGKDANIGATLRNDGIEVRSGDTLLRVDAITDEILRVRIAPDGELPEDASWAVPAEVRATRIPVSALEDGKAGFRTRALVVRVDPVSLRLVVEDAEGR